MSDKTLKWTINSILLIGICLILKGGISLLISIPIALLFFFGVGCIKERFYKKKEKKEEKEKRITQKNFEDSQEVLMVKQQTIQKIVEEQRERSSRYNHSLYSLNKHDLLLVRKGKGCVWQRKSVGEILEEGLYKESDIDTRYPHSTITIYIPIKYNYNYNLIDLIQEHWEKNELSWSATSRDTSIKRELNEMLQTHGFTGLYDFNRQISEILNKGYNIPYMAGEEVDPVYNPKLDPEYEYKKGR